MKRTIDVLDPKDRTRVVASYELVTAQGPEGEWMARIQGADQKRLPDQFGTTETQAAERLKELVLRAHPGMTLRG
jgi:hypothetical protein